VAHYAAVNHDFRFVAVFSPKCACSSIRQWLWDARTTNGTRPHAGEPWQDYGPLPGGLEAIAAHPGYRTVVFLRDPIRRVVSYYAHFVVGEVEEWIHADDDGDVDLRGRTFREAVGAVAEVARSGSRLQHHLVPQVDGIRAGLTFDEVVVVERFDTDIARFNRLIGNTMTGPWRAKTLAYDGPDVPAADLPPAWLRDHGLPRPARFLDDDLVATIADVYAADVDWYLSIPGTCLIRPACPVGPNSEAPPKRGL
jgi:hypothetical protein